MDDLYREVIIEHYKNPGFRGSLDPHDISFEDENPLCGDQIKIDLRVDENGKVKTFNSMVDALNFMSEKGWEFVQAYVTVEEKDSTTHWLLKKKAE